MKVQLRFFASVRERLGRREGELTLPEDATVGDLWTILSRQHTELGELGLDHGKGLAVAGSR